MGSQCFDVTVSDRVAHLRLSRPDAYNTMIPEFWSELPQIIDELDRRAEARVIVISSSGKHFSAGMDLSVFSGESTLLNTAGVSESGRRHSGTWMAVQHLQDSFTALERARMPVLAAVQGGCIGGAVDMVCAADMRYATADAFFCIQEINIGMTADVGTLQRLPKLIPEAVAKELAYTGRRLPAARALALGLVNEVFDNQEAMLAGVMQVASEIAAKPPIAIWGTKRAIHYTRDHSVADALQQMGWLQGAIWSNRHVQEAVTAMKEKRAGDFPDLATVQRFEDIGR